MLVVELPKGGARARGRAHGEAARELLRDGLQRWHDQLGTSHGGSGEEYLREFLATTGHLRAMRAHAPALVEEVAGIAEGAAVSFDEALVWQLVDELWVDEWRRRTATAEQVHCSTYGVVSDAGAVVAQNVDLPEWYDGLQTVLLLPAEADEPAAVVPTMAGFLATNGMNGAGVAVGVNAVPMLPGSSDGLPVACVIREALRCSTAAAAVERVQRVPVGGPQHYLIGDPTEVVSVEASAGGVTVVDRGRGPIAHTNHPLVQTPEPGAFEGTAADAAMAGSRRRLDLLRAGLTELGGADAGSAVAVLDRDGLCRRPGPAGNALSAFTTVFELGASPVARVRPGPDCATTVFPC